VVTVTRLDRLARSTRDLLNTLAVITDRKAGFRSLGDTWADTTTSHGRLMLTVLGGLAEFERDLIRTRTSEGRARAVARGQKMGRPPKLTPHQQREAINAATGARNPLPRLAAATTSARRRFRGSRREHALPMQRFQVRV
jgi:DNA invertase Pin-like site-specific DNA recombinase